MVPVSRMPETLAKIVEHKRAEVARAKARTPVSELEAMVAQEEQPRNFFRAVTRASQTGGVPGVTVIAEVKRKSPSAGWIRPEYDGDRFAPEEIATKYHSAGAAAISCLTDEHFFAGHLSYIHRIKESVPLPVLRKDFIIDPWQLWQSRAFGADAVLLIAECLEQSLMIDLLILAQQLQLTTLLEVHSAENLLRVRPYVGFPHPSYALLGINNRDLGTMRVDLGHTIRLVELVENRATLVSESGIHHPEDLERLRRVGVRIVLVGEHLMRQEDPGNGLRVLLGSQGDYSGGSYVESKPG